MEVKNMTITCEELFMWIPVSLREKYYLNPMNYQLKFVNIETPCIRNLCIYVQIGVVKKRALSIIN